MKGILAGVFIGVFFGALGYEIMNRSNPEIVDAIRRKVSSGVDKVMAESDNDSADEYEDDDDYSDMDLDQEPSPV